MQNNGLNKTYKCSKCDWFGVGDNLVLGEDSMYGYGLNCPKCGKEIDFYQFPVGKPTKDQELVHVDQLPDLLGDYMSFVLREIDEDNKSYIVITQHGTEIWREDRSYEYYVRFIEIGLLLKQKYGYRMMDFVPDVHSVYLYGDPLRSRDMVLDFRKRLINSGPEGFDISKYF